MALQYMKFRYCSLIFKSAFKENISSMWFKVTYEHLSLLCKFFITDLFIDIYEFRLLFISFTVKVITDYRVP